MLLDGAGLLLLRDVRPLLGVCVLPALEAERLVVDGVEAPEEEEQEAIHVDEAAYKAMCLREALERAAAAAENGISETEMEPEYW